MKIFTTINPHGNTLTQLNALSTWSEKYEVYSVNRKDEIDKIRNIYENINFIEIEEDFSYKGKNLVKLDFILEAIEKESDGISAIINSDIVLSSELEIKINQRYFTNGIFIGTRYEIDGDKKYPFIYGYDLFIFDSKYAKLFKNDKYVIGMPWWDYWVPICALKHRLNIYHIKDELIYHKTHKTNYEHKSWLEFGEYLYNDIIKDTLYSDLSIKLEDFYKGVENGPLIVKKFIESKQINKSVI